MQWLDAGKCRNVNHKSTKHKYFSLPTFLCCEDSILSADVVNSTFTNSSLTGQNENHVLRLPWKKSHCNSVRITVSAFALLAYSDSRESTAQTMSLSMQIFVFTLQTRSWRRKYRDCAHLEKTGENWSCIPKKRHKKNLSFGSVFR